MAKLLVHASGDGAEYKALFERSAPELRVYATPEQFDRGAIDYFAGWNPPPGLLGEMPRLKAVFALGAGVDGLLARGDLPSHVPVVRLLDAGMAEQMLEYALYGVLTWQRHMDDYGAQQLRAAWERHPLRTRADTRVGVLGLGRMGSVVAGGLARMGYEVWGWSRGARALEGVRCTSGEVGLNTLLERSDVLVNVLPSTPDTRGLLDRAALSRLPRGGYLVSCSRGDQVDEGALHELLEAGHLGGALLDVFAREPLPPESPLWKHPRVRITPHVAAITVPGPAVEQIVASIRTLEAGGTPEGLVDRTRGY